MSRILVTGAAGLIGRWTVADLAARGHDVHGVGRTPSGPPNVTWHQADLLDHRAMQRLVAAVRPQGLVHLAWETAHGAFWTSPVNLDWLAATMHLARAFHRHGGERFVAAGSCTEYDWSHRPSVEGVFSEHDSPVAPGTLYGTAKASTRQVLERFASETGIGFAWARIFFVYGPGEDPRRLVAAVARALVAGKPAEISRGRQIRDFLSAMDAGQAIAALFDADTQGVVNIGSGDGVAVAEIAALMAQMVGRPDLLRVGALPDRPNEPDRVVAAVDRLRSEVGYRPVRTLHDGLLETLSWWEAEPAVASKGLPA